MLRLETLRHFQHRLDRQHLGAKCTTKALNLLLRLTQITLKHLKNVEFMSDVNQCILAAGILALKQLLF